MFSSVPNDSEEGRAFLQERLAFFGKVCVLLFLAVATVGLGLMAIVYPAFFTHLRGPPVHVIAVMATSAAWILCRGGRRRSYGQLVAIDAITTILSGAGIAAIVIIGPIDALPAIPATVGVTHLLLPRAIIVPSDWRRTLIVSTVAALPAMVLVAMDPLGDSKLPDMLRFFLPVWLVVDVALATLTSEVIYRLRRRVVEARVLGQYTLLEKIGEGGMGVVHRARHAMLRRPTVVKLLPQDKAGKANVARFEREVQHTSQLTSPNTVAIYDFGRTPEGIFYYAMEYLDGIDLEKLVAAHGRQPPARVIHVLADVCAALAEAHETGLVHRDVKPGNIMICRHGGGVDVVKVLDFGLVKDMGGRGDVKLTQADAMVGTPLYVSPEALTDPDSVDARSDLYAVGAVGYFLLTGKPVFEARSVAEVSAHHIHTPATPPSKVVAVPADLEELLLACLEKSPASRPTGARALRAALLACADAGKWTDEDARAWWQGHPETGPRVDIALSETVSVAAGPR